MLHYALLILMAVLSVVSISHAADKVISIDTPSACVKIDRIEGDKAYLVSSGDDCPAVPGKAQIKVDGSVQSVLVYVDGQPWKRQNAREISVQGVSKLLEDANNAATEMKLPENIYQKEAMEQAVKSNDYFNSPEFQEKIQHETERLKAEVFDPAGKVIKTDSYYADASPKKNSGKGAGTLLSSDRLYLFISSSMPVETIRSYIASINSLNNHPIAVIMRGFVDGMHLMAPTASFISSIIKTDPDCQMQSGHCDIFKVAVQVDPLLFQRYGITQVPALVYASGVRVANPGSEGLRENVHVGKYFVIYGDAGLRYMLDRIHDRSKADALGEMVRTLR